MLLQSKEGWLYFYVSDFFFYLKLVKKELFVYTGGVGRRVSSSNQHVLREDDVVSCCLDLGALCMSFRVNGLPVQGMFENFTTDGLLFPVASFSAGVRWVQTETRAVYLIIYSTT